MRGKLKDRDLPTRTQGYGVCCPNCQGPLMLCLMRDGDQAYWCHRCEKGFRIGELPVDGVVILAPKQTNSNLANLTNLAKLANLADSQPTDHSAASSSHALPSPSPTHENTLSDQSRTSQRPRNSLGRKSRA